MASQLNVEPGYLTSIRAAARRQPRVVLNKRPRGVNPQVLGVHGTDGKYFCSDCRWILRQPLQSFCGHRYCTDCFTFLISSESQPVKCQSCVQEGTETEFSLLKRDQTFPDNGIRREVEGLPAVCINSNCPWNGNFKDYQIHEPACTHQKVQCDACGAEVKPQDLASHKTDQCPASPDRCPHCKLTMTRGELQNHDCDKEPITCPGCSKVILKDQLVEHSDPAICANAQVPCREIFGCSEIVKPVDLKEHLISNLETHIADLNQRIRHLAAELKNVAGTRLTLPPPEGATPVPATDISQQYSDLERRVRQSEDMLRDINQRMESSARAIVPNATAPGASVMGAVGGEAPNRQVEILDKKIVIFERVSAVFKREIEKCGRQIEELLKENQENKDRVESVLRQFQTIERQFTAQKTHVQDLTQRLQASEASSYDGILVWKLTDVRQKRLDAVDGRVTSFYSPCFFTSRTGYKACARIYMNGDGMGKNTHVSLFFVLMRGDYDALLPWPFQQKVTLMWMDQNRRENVMDTFRPDPTSSSFKRPTSDMNIASGCPLFMPLSSLDAPSQAYIKDDTAFIKIVIDKTNLDKTH